MGRHRLALTGFLANLGGCVNFLAKAVVGVTVMMWVRWTLPRLRIDQVMTMCLKYCVPLGAICFVGVLLWQVVGLPESERLGCRSNQPVRPAVRETWVAAAGWADRQTSRATRRGHHNPAAAAEDSSRASDDAGLLVLRATRAGR